MGSVLDLQLFQQLALVFFSKTNTGPEVPNMKIVPFDLLDSFTINFEEDPLALQLFLKLEVD